MVLSILRNGSAEAKQVVSMEINAVLDGAAAADYASTHSLPHNREMTHLAAQQIFVLIDALTAWVDTKKRAKSPASSSSSSGSSGHGSGRPTRSAEETANAYVEEFLSSISPIVMAKAAFRCKSYARALRHFEQNARKLTRSGFVLPSIFLFHDDDDHRRTYPTI
jgi:serine/threonine-protein kinase ATR